MRAAPAPLLPAAQLRRVAVDDGRVERLVAFADAHPRRGRRRPAAAQPGRDAAALGARLPDALAARDRVPLPAQARAALARAERVLRGRLRPRRGARGRVADGRRAARPPRGDRRRSACSTRASSCSARRPTGCYRFRAGRLDGAVLPGAEVVHVGGASHGGRLFDENVRGHLRFLAKHRGPREASGRGGCCSSSLRLRGARLPRRARAHVPRRGALARLRPASRGSSLGAAGARRSRGCCRRPGSGSGLRLVAATCVPAPARAARRAGAARAAASRPRSPGRSPRSSRAMTVDVRRPRSLGLALVAARRSSRPSRCSSSLRGRRAAGVDPARSARPRASPRPASRFGLALWRVRRRRRRRRALPPRARAQARRLRRALAARGRRVHATAACTPATRSRSGTASSRSSPSSAGVDPARRRCATRRACSCRSPSSSRTRPGRRVFRLGVARARRRSLVAGRALSRSRRARRLVHRARAAGDGERASCSSRPRSRSSSPTSRAPVARRPRARSRSRRSRSRSCTRPTRSSSLIPLAGVRRSRGRCSPAPTCSRASPRSRAVGASRRRRSRSGCCRSCSETASHRPRQRRAASARSRTTRASSTCFVRRQLPPRARGLRPQRRGRGRGARRSSRSPASPPRRRWAAFVLGGSLAVLALTLVPDALHALRRRRLALAGAPRGRLRPVRVRVRRRRCACSRGCSRLGALRSRSAPGSRSSSPARATSATRSRDGGPGVVDLVRAVRRRRRARRSAIVLPRRLRELDRMGASRAAAAASSCCRSRVHGFDALDDARARPTHGAHARARRRAPRRVPQSAVVFADADTSYRIAAYAPVYVANAPPAHVADTKANRPYERRDDADAFLRTGDLAIPRRYGAELDRRRPQPLPRRPTLQAGLRRTARTSSTVSAREGPARHALLPARGRRRRPAAAEVRHAPARARDRDARARARRPEVDPPRRGAAAADARRGCTARATSARAAGSPAEELHGTQGLERVGAQARLFGRRAARPRRERDLEPDGDPGRDPDRARARGSTSCSRPRRRARSTSSARR